MLETPPSFFLKAPLTSNNHMSTSKTSSTASPKSLSPLNPEESKQKSQLCRRYMQSGFCPYQKKCKFAHGSHQLLRNNQLNMKYKTKECDNFKNNFTCMYGNRCNFIHAHQIPISTQIYSKHDHQLQIIRQSGRSASRLMTLLHFLP